MTHVANVKIASSNVSADLTDYVVYVRLSDLPVEFWNLVANGGGDIRVYKSDGTTELAREVVSCDTSTDTGELHVKFSGTLSSSTDTTIQIHCDGTSSEPAATATYGRDNVWSNYEAVYHMEGSGDTLIDSSGNGDATLDMGSSAGDQVSGGIGNARNFDSGGDRYKATTVSADNTVNLTVQAIVKPTSLARVVAGFGEYDSGYYNAWHFDIVSNNARGEVYYSGTNRVSSGTATETISASVFNWYVMTFDGAASGALDFYINATKDTGASNTNASATSCLNTPRNNLYVGRNENSASESGFYGDIDELRIIKSTLTANWLTTEYNNQNSPSTFYSASPPQTHVATITIDATKVTADITDFVLYVDLSDLPAAFWDSVANGGGDIRVFKDDDTTELAREIVFCETTGDTGEMHVKFTGTLSSSVDTVIHIYTDGASAEPAATATYGRDNVWSNYEYVYHHNSTTDSAGNTNLTASGGVTAGSATGKLGNGTQFDGTDDVYSIADNDPAGSFVIQTWVNFDAYVSGQKQLIEKWSSSGSNRAVMLQKNESADTTDQRKLRGFFSSSGNFESGTAVVTTTPTTAGTWYMAHLRFVSSSTFDIYLNGSKEDTYLHAVSAIRNSTQAWLLGNDPTNSLDFDGALDETRIRFTTLSDDWISTEYNNQNSASTFYSTAAVGTTNTTLTATVTTFALTGTTTLFTRTIGMVAAAGSFTLTGLDVAWIRDKGFLAEAANFVLTGNDTNFQKALSMLAAAGTFTLTGVASTLTTLTKGKTLVAGVGTFIVSFLTTNLLQKPWGRTGRNTGIWTRSDKNDDE